MANSTDHPHASSEHAERATMRPGAALAAARMARKMSVQDMARLLKLSVAKVVALEADDHSGFPSPVYARGFVRTYARLLNVDIEGMMPARAEPTVKMDERMMHHVAGVPIEPRRRSHMPATIAGVLLVLAGLAYYEFVLNPPPGSFEIAAAGSTQTAPSAAPSEHDVMPGPSAAMGATSVRAPATAPAAEAPRTVTANVDVLQLKKSIDATSGVNEKGLHFMFNGESWVEVRDRGGKVVFSRINAPGSERVVQGEPPFSLVIGGASGVQLSYNGTPVNLASYVTEDVARLRLE